MKRTKTFEVEFNYFEPGTIVEFIDGFRTGKHEVKECHEPMFPGEDSVVFLTGDKFGVTGDRLRECTS